MAYKVIILYRLYMPSYFLGTFTEYPYEKTTDGEMILEALSIDDIRTRCPRFNEWMTKLEEGIRNDYF